MFKILEINIKIISIIYNNYKNFKKLLLNIMII